MTTHIQIATPDGPCTVEVAQPEGKGPWPAVIVFFDAAGLRPAQTTIAERIAASGYLVFQPDLFHRSPPLSTLLGGEVTLGAIQKVFQDPEMRGKFMAGYYMPALAYENLEKTVGAVLDHIAGRNDVRGGVGTTGYCMGGNASFRTATEQAAQQLGYDSATQAAVSCAWAAVGVGSTPSSCGGGNPPPPTGDGVLTNNTPVTGVSDSTTGGQKFWSFAVPAGQTSLTITISGGTGDADLYVQSGSKPTTTAYACRPYKNGNAETCTFTNPAAGTYWIMLNAYAAYSGVTLTGSYSASGGGGDPVLGNGTAVTNVSGAASSAQYWRFTPTTGATVTVKISGGSGDADLYTRIIRVTDFVSGMTDRHALATYRRVKGIAIPGRIA